MQRYINIYLSLMCFVLISCENPFGSPDEIPESFGSTYLDQLDDDNTQNGFGGGTHLGTSYSSGYLRLTSTNNNTNLTQEWTPQWSSLIAYWPMEESSWNGTANEVQDMVGTYHGNRIGNATTSTDAKIGLRSGTFDGTGDAIDNLGLVDISDSIFTYSVWVKTAVAIGGSPFSESTSGTTSCTTSNGVFQGYQLSPYAALELAVGVNGVSLAEHGNAWAPIIASYQANLSGWQHIAIRSIGEEDLELFVNGVMVDKAKNTSRTRIMQISKIGAKYACSLKYFNGQIDEFAVWSSALDPEEIRMVYNRQKAKFRGEYVSRIMDGKKISSTWNSLEWSIPLPYGKELPDGGGLANSENTNDYLEHSNSNLMEGIIGLWHFNESTYGDNVDEVADQSGEGNHGRAKNGNTNESYGKFSRAASFNGSTQYIEVEHDSSLNTPDDKITMQAWVRIRDVNLHGVLITKRYHATNIPYNSYILDYNATSKKLRICIGQAGNQTCLASTTTPQGSRWYHLVGVYDGSKLKIYLNGIEENQTPLTGSILYSTEKLYIGGGFVSWYFSGSIDEVAIWNRNLSAEEVVKLYQRGANRVLFQTRVCSMSTCSDQEALTDKGWKGPGGDAKTFFSELYQNSSMDSNCAIPQACFPDELLKQGNVLSRPEAQYFNLFGADGADELTSQYFQYRTVLESDDELNACNGASATCLPKLRSIEIGPKHIR